MLALFALFIISSFFVTGCTRYAKEEQLVQLDETEASALAAEERVAELEKEKADLEKKLAEKQDELKQVQAEKEKIQNKLQ
jgi:TolA-binding protein